MIACFLFTKKDRLRVFRFVRLHCLSFLFYSDRAPRTIYAMKLKVHTVLSAVMEQRNVREPLWFWYSFWKSNGFWI